MFVLDTNVVSELRKVRSGKADPCVAKWVKTVDAASCYLSAITILEIETGVLQMERRDPIQGALLRTWMDGQVLREFSGRILPVDAAVARQCARFHVPQSQAERDALISATAQVHSMTVVTRNIADFQSTGVGLLNPWLP